MNDRGFTSAAGRKKKNHHRMIKKSFKAKNPVYFQGESFDGAGRDGRKGSQKELEKGISSGASQEAKQAETWLRKGEIKGEPEKGGVFQAASKSWAGNQGKKKKCEGQIGMPHGLEQKS